jgi:hypothetical protein
MLGEKSQTLANHMAQEGALVGSWTADTSGETPVGISKLVEAIGKSYSDFLAHSLEVCKGILSDQLMHGCKG